VRRWNAARGKPSCAAATVLSVDSLLVVLLPAYMFVCVHLLLTGGSSGMYSSARPGKSTQDACQRELTVALMLAYPCMLAMVAYLYARPAGVFSFVLTVLMAVVHALVIGRFASFGCAVASPSSVWSPVCFCLFLLSSARVFVQTVDNSACIRGDDRQPAPAAEEGGTPWLNTKHPTALKQQGAVDATALMAHKQDTQTQLTSSFSSASACTADAAAAPLVPRCDNSEGAMDTASASYTDLHGDLCAMCCCSFDSAAVRHTISSASQLLPASSPASRARILLQQCAHSYHAQCISSYYRQHGSCPACRGHLPLLSQRSPAQSIASASDGSAQAEDSAV